MPRASFGSGDKSLIEFKLGGNTQLKRNLEKQVAIYEKANRTRNSVKVIVYYTEKDEQKAKGILKRLKLENEESIVLIDRAQRQQALGVKGVSGFRARCRPRADTPP